MIYTIFSVIIVVAIILFWVHTWYDKHSDSKERKKTEEEELIHELKHGYNKDYRSPFYNFSNLNNRRKINK